MELLLDSLRNIASHWKCTVINFFLCTTYQHCSLKQGPLIVHPFFTSCRYLKYPGTTSHPVSFGPGWGGPAPWCAGWSLEAAGPPDPGGGSVPREGIRRLEEPWNQMKWRPQMYATGTKLQFLHFSSINVPNSTFRSCSGFKRNAEQMLF